MMWPFTVAHRIDKRSPLYSLGPKELLASKFEMVVTLEGIVEPTGNSVQARTSYLPNELLWGHRYLLSFFTSPQGLSCTVQILVILNVCTRASRFFGGFTSHLFLESLGYLCMCGPEEDLAQGGRFA